MSHSLFSLGAGLHVLAILSLLVGVSACARDDRSPTPEPSPSDIGSVRADPSSAEPPASSTPAATGQEFGAGAEGIAFREVRQAHDVVVGFLRSSAVWHGS